MPFILVILMFLFMLALYALSAWCFMTGVPAAIANPANFWAWLTIVAGITLLKSSVSVNK